MARGISLLAPKSDVVYWRFQPHAEELLAVHNRPSLRIPETLPTINLSDTSPIISFFFPFSHFCFPPLPLRIPQNTYLALARFNPAIDIIMPAALLIGEITHARKEWEGLSSILTLKVKTIESPDMRRSVLMRFPGVGIPLRD